MRIWVTGASGYIGRQLCPLAVAEGHEVIALSRANLNLSDHDEVLSCVRRHPPDVVIHLAWYAHPSDYLTSGENVVSLQMTLGFARALFDAGCPRFVSTGTCLEYADLPRPRAESDPIDPRSLYARTKHAAHLVLEELAKNVGAKLVWARLFHMHGASEHPSRLIPTAIRALREGRRFGLSPGLQLRDHLDVRDVASALLHLAQREVSGTHNVCSGLPISLHHLMTTLGEEVGRPELLDFGSRSYAEGEIMTLAGNPARLAETHWRPRHSDLRASLRDAVAELSKPG